jgi:hypothetical protein
MNEGTFVERRLSPRARRLIRAYGLLVLIAIGFLLLAMLVREKPKTVPAQGWEAPVSQVVQTA